MPQSHSVVENSTSLTKSLTLSFAAILAALLSACAPTNFDQVAVEEAAQIIGGSETADSNAVARSTVGIAMIKNNLSHFLCTGVLVSPDIVITAAHCYTLTGATRTYVSFGVKLAGFSSQDPLTIEVESRRLLTPETKRGFLYPQTQVNDIAILKLKKKAPVAFIPAPISNDEVNDGQKLTLAGFGAVVPSGSGRSDTLRHVQVEVSKTWKSMIVTDQRDGRGACNGDSGGPGYVTTSKGLVVVGVTRGAYDRSPKCDYYGEYTSLSHHLSFIKKSVAEMGGVSPRYVDLR